MLAIQTYISISLFIHLLLDPKFSSVRLSNQSIAIKQKRVDSTFNRPSDYARMSHQCIFLLDCTLSGLVCAWQDCFQCYFPIVILSFDISRSTSRGWWIARQQNRDKVLLNCRHQLHHQIVDLRSHDHVHSVTSLKITDV